MKDPQAPSETSGDTPPSADRREMRSQPALGDALAHLVKRLLNRGQNEIERVATTAGSRLELRTMRKDLDHFWVRLGKTSYHLVNAGELDHPALRKAMARIDELEARIDALRADRGKDEAPAEE